jgi:hypothetical protein
MRRKAAQCNRRVALVLTTALVVNVASPAFAHNERIHQAMTDYAYHLALAMAQVGGPGNANNALVSELATLLTTPGMADFMASAAVAVPKLRNLPSGLADDPVPCLPWTPPGKLLGLHPDWLLSNGSLAIQPMRTVVYPVTVRYLFKNGNCAIDIDYRPVGSTILMNPATGTTELDKLRSRDHTGVTLGYWAAGPDRELGDWRFRSSLLETLSSPYIKIPAGLGASSLAGAACAIACGLFPPSCAICPVVAFEAGSTVIDGIDELYATTTENEDYIGLGHHIDLKTLPTGSETFDQKPGKFMERAGPTGVPDLFEEAIMALFDLLGLHVRHDSQGPMRYQIAVAGTDNADFHADTVFRSSSAWGTPTGAHIQYTPVDNLALWGWNEFRAAKVDDPDSDPPFNPSAAPRLGAILHALGDAVSPMHTNGATGFGHRPYEESVDNKWEELVFATADVSRPGAFALSLRQAREIVSRALVWRQFILEWRAATGKPLDMPVRDLVTRLARQIRTKSASQSGVFNAGSSLVFQFVSEPNAISAYDGAAMTAFQRDTVLDGIAATLAVLISSTEVN